MKIGIGLPTTITGVQGTEILEWARRSETRGFSAVATLDRIVYGNYEPLIALAAVAAVTKRVELMTGILITPYRANTALLAKELATLHHLSQGRLVLGLGIGARSDDYTASGLSTETRGRVFDQQLEELGRIWSGEERGTAGAIGPHLPDGPPDIVIGGKVDVAFERAATHGAGWIAGGGGASTFGESVARLTAAWREAGREDTPRAVGFMYYALGEDARGLADGYLKDYYAFAGPYAEQIAAAAATDVASVREAVERFQEAGATDLLFFPCATNPQQVDLLAEATGEALHPPNGTAAVR